MTRPTALESVRVSTPDDVNERARVEDDLEIHGSGSQYDVSVLAAIRRQKHNRSPRLSTYDATRYKYSGEELEVQRIQERVGFV